MSESKTDRYEVSWRQSPARVGRTVPVRFCRTGLRRADARDRQRDVARKTYATVTVTGASGTIKADSASTAVAKVTLSGVTSHGATVNVYGEAAGRPRSRCATPGGSRTIAVTVTPSMTVSPTSMSLSAARPPRSPPATRRAPCRRRSGNNAVATVSVSGNAITVKGVDRRAAPS